MKSHLPLLISLLTTACADVQEIEGSPDYSLQIEPIVARNQPDLFSEFDALELQLQHIDGTTEHYMLTQLNSGNEEVLNAMSHLDQTTIALLGLDAIGTPIGIGRTQPITMSDGEQRQSILVAKLDHMAEMAPLNDGRMGAQLVAVGDGVFLLFGGSKEYADQDGTINPTPSGFSSVMEINIGSPDTSLAFESVGEMPPRDGGTGSCDDRVCDRVNFSATLLTKPHDDKGKVLVMGGAYDYLGSKDVSASGFLWDPTTHTAEVLEGNDAQLLSPTFMHTATEGPQGNVVFAGGSSDSNVDNTFYARSDVEIYDPFTRELSLASGTAQGMLIWHSAARLSEEGVLLCGGTSFGSLPSYELSRTCDLVDVSGGFVAQDDNSLLPIGLVHHQMTTLADGRILVTGGFSGDSDFLEADPSGYLSAEGSSRAFIYDGESWEETGAMSVGRGGHGATLLPDGKVLLVGGEYTTDSLFPDGFDAIACAEVFDPETSEFTPLSSCDPDSPSGDLSLQAAHPAVASDPIFGALVAGGQINQDSTDEVMFFTAEPEG